MIDKNRNINTTFGLFLTSFLIIGTVMIFAVLVFLSYQSCITSIQDKNYLLTDATCGAVGSDINAFNYLKVNGDLSDDSFDLLVTFELNSSQYSDVDWIVVTDTNGNVLFSNRGVTEHIDPEYLVCLDNARQEDTAGEGKVSTLVSEDRLVATSAVIIPNTDYCVIVSNVADPSEAIEQFKNTTLLPAAVALLVIKVISFINVLKNKSIEPAIVRDLKFLK